MSDIPGEVIPLVAIGGGMLVGIVAIVCGTVYGMYRFHRQSQLKQLMLEAGMSANDIERVMNCGLNTDESPNPIGIHREPVVGPQKQPPRHSVS